MMKFLKTFFLIALTNLSLQLNGQQHFMCGHEWVMHHLEKQFPGYSANVHKEFGKALAYVEEARNINDVLTIPVVVHVVYKNDNENLHDSLLENQISVLNESFRLQNDNRDEVRPIFKDLQADAGIEFVLQEVKRVKTSANFALSLNGLPDQVKRSANGGSDAVSPTTALNIWVCRIQPIPIIGGQILGYAYPPAGLSNWPAGSEAPSTSLEGVVIDFRAFGRNNPNILEVNGKVHEAVGRTAVHEVGHYLGLRHIWGDGGGIFGGSSCSQDDGIEDTPNQGQQSAGVCNSTQNTCTDASADLPDMIENYMDYSAETCQNSFTKQQVGLMRAVLQNQRIGLLSRVPDYPVITENCSVFPNPFVSEIWINLESTPIDPLLYTVFDINGIPVRSGSSYSDDQLISLDLWDLSAGIYSLSVTHSQKSYSKKIVKLNGR